MKISRRAALSGVCAPLLTAAPFIFVSRARALADDGVDYQYDALGRLARVTLSDGTIIIYDYDAAGNRTRRVRGDLSPFNHTLQITGAGPINLRTVADMAGYTGLTNATITFQVGSAVTIAGAPGAPNGGAGIDTGAWPSSAHTIALTLQVSGKVYGGGGAGNGGTGGDAIYCRENLSITVNSGGQVKAGGGGGGRGGGWRHDYSDGEGNWETSFLEGGGGGGGFPNGPGGASGGPGAAGGAGATGGGGAGGAGGTLLSHTCGAGGAGGGAAAVGATGANGSGSASCNSLHCWYGPDSGAAGGQPGYAVRKNGKTVPVTNNGTISGTVG